MGSIASTNPSSTSAGSSNNGLSDLMQTLTNENSPLLSTLSSPSVQSALENAPLSDIVEISEQALQLQSVDALFGLSSTANTSSDSLFTALADIGSNTGSSSATSPNTGSSLADQLAAYEGNVQTQEAQTLLGINPSTNTPTGSLIDLVG
jgi:hypothetical protein